MNIASNEDSSLDICAAWVTKDQIHLNVRLNEDGAGDTEIDYQLTPDEVEYVIDFLVSKLKEAANRQ